MRPPRLTADRVNETNSVPLMSAETNAFANEFDRSSPPRISIGLPVCNGANFLACAIASLLAQSFRDFELIICDNASTDETESICRRYAATDARIRYFRNETNIGAAANFNLTFKHARGEYFKWAAHDDMCLPDFLHECVAALDADPSIVLSTTEARWIDDHGSPTEKQEPALLQLDSPLPQQRFRELILVNHWCIDVFGVMRRQALARTRQIDHYVNSDRVLLANLGLLGRMVRVKRPLFLSRDHQTRSIRSIKMRDRGAWFNPRLKGTIALPYWRTLFEYWRVFFSVPLAWRARGGCIRALLRWPVRHRHFLWEDLKHAACRIVGLPPPVRNSGD